LTVSLRLRLGLCYGGLTGLVVLLISVFTYAVHSRSHYDDLDRALVGAAQHLASQDVTLGASGILPRLLAVPIAPDVAVRIYDPTGRLLTQAPNAPAAPPVNPQAIRTRGNAAPFDPLLGLAPAITPVHPGQGTFGLVTGHDGVRWRVYVLPIGTTGQQLAVLASLTHIDEAITGYRRLVVLFAVGGAMVTFFAGWLLARRALRPVATLTATARAIGRSRDFHHRVPVGTAQDELGQLAATFNEMLTNLEQLYQAQQRFVADASHELRAPLTAIQANLELLQHQPAMTEADQREAVREAGREAQRLAVLVADLLALARADAGMPLRRRRVELDRVLLEAVGTAQQLARGQQVQVDHLEPALVDGDPDRLKQLVLILLDNAIKYTPPAGKVTVGLCRQGATAQVVVADTGIGIAAEDLPHVFERFYRADPARGRDIGGTGLGLPIAQWIAEHHGGRVALTSTPGQGTTAIVDLPLIP
jgi:signal transduction histidine kinase